MTRILAILALLGVASCGHYAIAADNGQWEATPHDVRVWYRNLMQPDNPTISCCGEADAYHADTFFVRDGKTIAVITDTRDDSALGRPSIPAGTEVVVPDTKMKWDAGNPTGHGVIFIGGSGHVLCYVAPGGV